MQRLLLEPIGKYSINDIRRCSTREDLPPDCRFVCPSVKIVLPSRRVAKARSRQLSTSVFPCLVFHHFDHLWWLPCDIRPAITLWTHRLCSCRRATVLAEQCPFVSMDEDTYCNRPQSLASILSASVQAHSRDKGQRKVQRDSTLSRPYLRYVVWDSWFR